MFYYEQNPKTKQYDIFCLVVMDPEKPNTYPDFLQQHKINKQTNKINSNFVLQIKTGLFNQNEAQAEIDYLNDNYESLLSRCEIDGLNWNSFPFTNRPVISASYT